MNWQGATAGVIDQVKGTFGRAVTYTPQGQAALTLDCVFNNPSIAIEVGGDLNHTRSVPTLFVKLADLPSSPKKGDRVEVDGTHYRVIDSQEDGQGGSLLFLNKA
jgi:hypothetical protein